METAKIDLRTAIGFDPKTHSTVTLDPKLIEFINLKLVGLGEPVFGQAQDNQTHALERSLLDHYRAKDTLRQDVLAPVDLRIQNYLDKLLAKVDGAEKRRLPAKTFILSQHGLARTLSLPANQDEFHSDIVDSYRLANGVLHNPKSDRRTTQGVFHVAEGGMPIPADKKSVPLVTFARLLEAALQPPQAIKQLPFTAGQKEQAKAWVTLMLRPVVCPEVPGFIAEKSMEVRFFVPGNLVSNLDFVESIFGNAGDPYLPENDAALDIEHWSGHTGCIILAPHLTTVRKKDVGLPHVSQATERQKRDRMCWEKEDELYNDGSAFKLTSRDTNGVVVTLIADNYFGYCKKEVKTQLGFSANLMGLAEEEHAGGAMAFPSYDLGEDFIPAEKLNDHTHFFADMVQLLGDRIELKPEGYAVDRQDPEVLYVPETARFNLNELRISWTNEQGAQQIKLLAGKVYLLPSGYKIRMARPAEGRRWRLIGTNPEGTFCHKPCTVSGGGKSEISKSIEDAIIHAPFYVRDLKEDLDAVERILAREYGGRYKDAKRNKTNGRKILSADRSLGSVIKLFSPSDEFTDEHNAFIRSIPNDIKELLFLLKRFYKADWGPNWRERFSVDVINGVPGHELKYRNGKLNASYLRVGYEPDGSWRVFGLRKDFAPASKIQLEDDITASVSVPTAQLSGLSETQAKHAVLKFAFNCEYRLFQRPDDAIVRGYDKQTELDMSQPGNFFSNYQPLTRADVKEMIEDAVRFDYFTAPMKQMLRDFVEKPEGKPAFIVCSANPRLVDGVPTKNPRYLQTRTGLVKPRHLYVAELGLRLARKIPFGQPVHSPVDAILPGRRNNPPEKGVRSLAVFNPIHYMELPEMFMEFTSSMTGKSPSTTGAGSEGALTKGPFNAVLPIIDLNNALVAFIVGGYSPFITAAGYVGPKFRVDHDVSLLVPEVWCRMREEERDPQWLIDNGYLEPVPDITVNGQAVASSILGYRINAAFISHFMGRVFSNPSVLFTEEMLKPELQDPQIFADGMDNILATHRNVAKNYFEDGSIERACPPLKALLHIMAHGTWEGKTLSSPEFRALFTREAVLKSAWYQARLQSALDREATMLECQRVYLERYPVALAGSESLLAGLKAKEAAVKTPQALKAIQGTIGRDPGVV